MVNEAWEEAQAGGVGQAAVHHAAAPAHRAVLSLLEDRQQQFLRGRKQLPHTSLWAAASVLLVKMLRLKHSIFRDNKREES